MAYERAGHTRSDVAARKQLRANDDDVTTRVVTMAAGQNQPEGAVIGKITAGGQYALSVAAAGDGSQVPDLILAEDCDATAGPREAVAYETVTAVSTALTLGTGHSVASIREGLRGKGIKIDD